MSVESAVYHDVDLDALTETLSYFDLDEIDNYYRHCETDEGGLFPVGLNRIWQGGVHLEPGADNPVVYAAASGTIVAARLSSHPDTDAHPGYGSQRFVLLRHAVHWRTEPTPNAPPGTAQQRINYNATSSYVFSLYMHLDAIPDLYAEHAENPGWYNKWLRQKARTINGDPDRIPTRAQLEQEVGMSGVAITPGGEKGMVFNPGIEVSVGDVLGLAGDLDVVNRELAAAGADPAAMMTVVAPRLRDIRVRHRSSWSWDRPELLNGVASPASIKMNWPHLSRMMWVQDALLANPDLVRQLGNSNFFWHYHPITFMAAINRLILGENREITQAPFQNVPSNVEVDEDYYLTTYFDFRAGAWQPANADNQPLKPYEFESTGFSVTRARLACEASKSAPPLPPSPDVPTPQGTKFSLALLEIFERVRGRFNDSLAITCAYVCPGHIGEVGRCCRNDFQHVQAHLLGIAIDCHPDRTRDKILALWRELRTVRDAYNAQARLHAGTACHGNLPSGYGGWSSRPRMMS